MQFALSQTSSTEAEPSQQHIKTPQEGPGCPSCAAASWFSHSPLSERSDAPGENPSKREGHPGPSPRY
ncbi:MAG: hypothetical protein QOF13_468 [Solirubrobacterales bacterium]|nr:hypothetical protein [Solirubrobacterales bacterium]